MSDFRYKLKRMWINHSDDIFFVGILGSIVMLFIPLIVAVSRTSEENSRPIKEVEITALITMTDEKYRYDNRDWDALRISSEEAKTSEIIYRPKNCNPSEKSISVKGKFVVRKDLSSEMIIDENDKDIALAEFCFPITAGGTNAK